MSESTNTLTAALARAQGEMQNAPLNKTNPHFKSKYADLAAIRDATLPALSKNGLAITQYTTFADNVLLLRTELRHTSGEKIEATWPIQIEKPQQMGSALTYAKRYSWAAMCGIAAEEDDDANVAQSGTRPAANGNGVKPATWQARMAQVNDDIKKAGDLATLQTVWRENWKHISAMPQEVQDELTRIKDDKKAEFDESAKMLAAG